MKFLLVISSITFLASIPALLLGLAVPKVYNRLFKGKATRWAVARTLGAVMVGSFIVVLVTVPPSETVEPKEVIEEASADEQRGGEEAVPAQEEAQDASDMAAEDVTEAVTVIKVVDGDTLSVSIGGKSETIRIIGINTPETVDPRKPVECFGQEASAKAHELLDGKSVTLEADATQGERDKYGRLLRYVFLPDGSDFGKAMISGGFAYEYTYSVPYKYQEAYKAAQGEAQAAKRGLWADGACSEAEAETEATVPSTSQTETQAAETGTSAGGSSTSEPTTAEPSAPVDSPSTDTTTDTSTSADPLPSTTTASCSCSSNSYNCDDFSTHDEAQAVYDCCIAQVGYDVHKLDGSDNDGLACESLP